MKRISELRKLSDDHHHGLVLARRARLASDADTSLPVSSVWAEIEQAFHNELAPHFLIEENYLAPPLLALGEEALVSRMMDDHFQFRSMIDDRLSRSLQSLNRLGELLDRHIHFEERELFEVAQKRLSPEALTKIEIACKKKNSDGSKNLIS